MRLGEKLRYLREVEGTLRNLGRAMTQQEIVRARHNRGDREAHLRRLSRLTWEDERDPQALSPPSTVIA